MAPAPKHRDAIVETAVRLFRKQGYTATGLNEIIAESGAPKGSLYHYFPDGKLSIAAEAVTKAGNTVQTTLTELAKDTSSAGDLLRRYIKLLGGWMAKSGFRDGGPITTTVLETVPQTEPIRVAASRAFASWAAIFADRLRESGVPKKRAERLAWLAIAALEGALLLSRVEAHQRPLLDMADEMAAIFDRAVADAKQPSKP